MDWKSTDLKKNCLTKKSKTFLNAEVEKSTREFLDGLNFSDEVSAAVAADSLGSTLYYIGITDRVDNNAYTYDSDGKVLYPINPINTQGCMYNQILILKNPICLSEIKHFLTQKGFV